MQIFKSTKNTRSLPSGNVKYIRSDVPTVVTEDERAWLLSHRITTVIDLRTDRERAQKPCPLSADARFTYNAIPLAGGDRVPKSPDAVSASYIAMVDAAFDTAIELLLNAEGGVLYFCNAGKDRTGVLTAALLYTLGVSQDEIVADYMLSKANLEEALRELAAKDTSIDIETVTPQPRYIEEFLSWYGGRDGWSVLVK